MWNGRKQAYQPVVGKKVPVSSFDPATFDSSPWRSMNNTYSVNEDQIHRRYDLTPFPAPHKFTECCITVGGLSGDWITVDWNDDLETLANRQAELQNLRVEKLRELFELLQRHDDLPQLKKRIKKQVVGRVLKNTDDGKLLLKALKGIRKADTTKALTMDG
jgi:hypothetical protein